MADPKTLTPNYGSEQGRKEEDENERAGQRRDQQQPGQGPGGQSGDRDRASNPQEESGGSRQPKPGQPSGQNVDR